MTALSPENYHKLYTASFNAPDKAGIRTGTKDTASAVKRTNESWQMSYCDFDDDDVEL